MTIIILGPSLRCPGTTVPSTAGTHGNAGTVNVPKGAFSLQIDLFMYPGECQITLYHIQGLHSPLQMFSPENGVCNFLALEEIYGMLIPRIHAFLPPEL